MNLKKKTLDELLNNKYLVDNRKISIEKTNESFEYWLNKAYITPSLRKNLKKVNVLFVPTEYYNSNEPQFHANALKFSDFLKKQKDKKINTALCIEDKDYRELHLHSESIKIGEILVEYLILPIFFEYLMDFLKDFISKRIHRNNSIFEFKINVQKEDKNMTMEFEGTTNDLKEVINNIDF